MKWMVIRENKHWYQWSKGILSFMISVTILVSFLVILYILITSPRQYSNGIYPAIAEVGIQTAKDIKALELKVLEVKEELDKLEGKLTASSFKGQKSMAMFVEENHER